jgi:hypothetical protein
MKYYIHYKLTLTPGNETFIPTNLTSIQTQPPTNLTPSRIKGLFQSAIFFNLVSLLPPEASKLIHFTLSTYVIENVFDFSSSLRSCSSAARS